MIPCARCGFQNNEGKRFCVRCGALLSGSVVLPLVRCVACGHQNENDQRFCSRCGASLAVSTPSVPPSRRCPACGHMNVADKRFCARCGIPLVIAVAPPTMTPKNLDGLVGQMLTEYKIVEKVGQGGMATVFRAIQTTLKRPAAIKILAPEMAQDSALLARFHQEAISAANLEHPHIVPIYEVDEAQGYHFIAMKYIEGDSLKRVIAREGPLAWSRVHDLVDQIAGALDYAHERGFVHRDVKPSNVMVAAGDYVYLMDFGLSRAVVSSQLTVAGTVMGTPDYMSPEQARGDGDIDRHTDIYSLGAMLYEMLVGQVPFHDLPPAAVIMAQISQPPPSALAVNPDLSAEVDAVIQRAMAKERTERYETAGAVAAALRNVKREM